MALISSAYAEEFVQQDAHVHGEAYLDLVLEGKQLSVSFESPAVNLVGFEHAPQTEAEKARLNQSVQTLKNRGGELLGLPAAAECQQSAFQIESALLKSHSTPTEAGEAHSDFDVAWHFNCAQPMLLTELKLKLFATFSGLSELRVQLITPQGQKGVELTPTHSELKF